MQQAEMLPDVIPNYIDIQITDDNTERDEQIAFKHIIKGIQQIDLSREYNVCPQRISQIIQKFVNDEKCNKQLVTKWKKDLANKTMKAAVDIVESIDITKLSDNSKPTQAAILIDKSMLLSGESSGSSAPQINIVNYGDVTIK